MLKRMILSFFIISLFLSACKGSTMPTAKDDNVKIKLRMATAIPNLGWNIDKPYVYDAELERSYFMDDVPIIKRVKQFVKEHPHVTVLIIIPLLIVRLMIQT